MRVGNGHDEWKTLEIIKKYSPLFLITVRFKLCLHWIVQSATPKRAYRGADKSLARAGRKQAREHIRDVRDFSNIETRAFFFCKARRRRKFTPFWQKG